MSPYVAVDFSLTPVWNIFKEHVGEYWDFDNPPSGVNPSAVKMVMTLKAWLT